MAAWLLCVGLVAPGSRHTPCAEAAQPRHMECACYLAQAQGQEKPVVLTPEQLALQAELKQFGSGQIDLTAEEGRALASRLQKAVTTPPELVAILGRSHPPTISRQILFGRYREIWLFGPPFFLVVRIDHDKGDLHGTIQSVRHLRP